jgi:DNA-binding NtrC family response regulator
MKHCRILVAGDDAETRESLSAGLRAGGYAVDAASSAREALDLAHQRDYAISLLDFAGGGGYETLARIRRLRPQCFLIVLTASGSLDPAIAAMEMEALESAVKPCSPDDISIRIGRIIQFRNLQRENAVLREQLARQLEPPNPLPGTISAGMTLNEMEKVLIASTIQRTRGNIKEAASVLGIDRSTLYEKIRRYGIPR